MENAIRLFQTDVTSFFLRLHPNLVLLSNSQIRLLALINVDSDGDSIGVKGIKQLPPVQARKIMGVVEVFHKLDLPFTKRGIH